MNHEAHRDSVYSNNYMDMGREGYDDDMDVQRQHEINSEEETDSVLSDISNESSYFEKKVHYQQRALFRKNVTLQTRQVCTNICQVITPILGLLILKML